MSMWRNIHTPVEISIETSNAGVQSSKLLFHLEGAPNFRSVARQHVYGTAMPTVEGIKRVLSHVGCAPSSPKSDEAVMIP